MWFLFFFILVAYALGSVEEESIFFYQSSHHLWHVNDGNTILTVTNAQDFNVTHGYAFASYSRDNYDITLLSYRFKYNPDENVKSFNVYAENGSYNDCPLFEKKVIIAAYRVQHRNNQEGCNSIETVRRYLQYYDSHLRLLSGNRVRVDFENSMISNVCCPCSEEECYGPNSYGTFINKVGEACDKLDPHMTSPRMTRLFINDQFGGFAGLASLGNINSYAKNGNYWAICNVNSEPTLEWHWYYQLSVVIHELGHTMGFGHAAYTEANPTYFLRDYEKPDNYGDGGNVMGGGNYWDTIVGPIQYYNVFSNKKVEPFYFHTAEKSERKTIRLFAWDHPYSRPFLGIESPRLSENEMIDSIPYQNNMLTYEFPYNREDMCSTVSDLVSFGSFYLEYRNRRGSQTGAGNRGVRLIQGRVTRTGGYDTSRSVMLSAGVDGLYHWGDGVIPFGVLWVPENADKGTIGVQIKKLHSVADYVDEGQLDDGIQDLSAIPYMEVEVTYTPNVKYIPPLHPSPLPSYTFSSNINSCEQNEDSTGWVCSLVGPARFWFNMDASGHRGHPRVWNGEATSWVDSASSSIVSYESSQRLSWTHFYGDYTRGKCTVTVNREKSGGSSTVWIGTQLFRRGIHESDDQFKAVDSGDILLANGFAFEKHDKLALMDLYGYEEEIKVSEGENHLLLKLPTRTLPGFYEAFLVNKREGKIVYSQAVNQYHSSLDEDRVAVEMIDATFVTVSSAGIPSTKYSAPSMFHSRSLSRNEQLPVFLQDWQHGDYIFIDFTGKLPKNLVMMIDSDNDVIELDLKRFGGQKDFTLKVSFTQLINRGSVDGQIHFIWFNHGVTIQSIRAALTSNPGNAQGKQSQRDDYYNLGDYRYKGIMNGFTSYTAREYSSRFNGKKYDLNTELTDQYRVKFADVGSFNWWNVVWVVLIVLVVFLLLSCFTKWVKKGKEKKQLSRTQPRKVPTGGSQKPASRTVKSLEKSTSVAKSDKPAPPTAAKPTPPSTSKPTPPSAPKPTPTPPKPTPTPPKPTPPSASKPTPTPSKPTPTPSKPTPTPPKPSPPVSSKPAPPSVPKPAPKPSKSTPPAVPSVSKPTKTAKPTPTPPSKPKASSNPFDSGSYKNNISVKPPPKNPFKPSRSS